MTAQEARQKAEEIVSGDQSIHMTLIRNNISVSVSRGLFNCSLGKISPSIKKILESEGYTVDCSYDFRDGAYTKISW